MCVSMGLCMGAVPVEDRRVCRIGGTGLAGGCEPPDGVLGIELMSSKNRCFPCYFLIYH